MKSPAAILGKKGGQSTSPAKIRAARRNAKKATAARMKKRVIRLEK